MSKNQNFDLFSKTFSSRSFSSISLVATLKILEIIFDSLSCSHPTFSPSINADSSNFKMYPESSPLLLSDKALTTVLYLNLSFPTFALLPPRLCKAVGVGIWNHESDYVFQNSPRFSYLTQTKIKRIFHGMYITPYISYLNISLLPPVFFFLSLSFTLSISDIGSFTIP